MDVLNSHYTETVYITIGLKPVHVILMQRTHTFFDDNWSAYEFCEVYKRVPIAEYKQLGLSNDIWKTVGIEHFVQWAHTTGQPVSVSFTKYFDNI